MNNRAIKKLLSVVLVMAICVSTVFGCLITVNAADTGATYTVTAESLHAYADEGKATITFDLESGFTRGEFTLLKNDNITHSKEFSEDKNGDKTVVPSPWDYEYKDVEIKVVGGTDINGNAVSAEQMNIKLFYDTNGNGNGDADDNGNDIIEQVDGDDVWAPNNSLWFNASGEYKDAEGNNFEFDPENGTVYRHKDYKLSDVSFDSGDVVYKSITFEFEFEWAYCMQPNSKNEIRFANSSQKDQDGNAYADPVLKNGDAVVGTLTENIIDGNVNYFHSHVYNNVGANGQLLQQNDYEIYSIKCRECGDVSNQVITDELTSEQPNAYYDISAINIVYEDDGTVSLNAHCPGFRGEKDKLLISYTNGKKTIYGDNKTSVIAGNTSFKKSPYAKEKIPNENGSFYYSDNALPADTYMYEIKGLSAKDIDSKFYITRIVEGSGQYEGGIFCGHTQEVSLSSYGSDVVDGKKVYYPEGTTPEQIAADKAVAVAFINYGVAATNALNHKVSYEKEEIVVTDTWDGTKSEPTETDDDGNVIINTAEELAWVALLGGDATQNKNYKVADNTVFNMNGMEGINVNSTAAQVKAATKSTTNLWRLASDGSSPAFQGNFDGNGLIVYNLYTGAGRSHSGLFPATNSTAQTSITIKNISVVASHIGGYHGAGAIVGIANTGNTSTKMFFENCAVKNCFIYDNDDTNPGTKKIGGVIAGEIVHNATTINNCLAINNQVDSQGIQGGFFGNSSNYAGQSTVTNSITIGTTAEPVSINTALASKVATTTYTNVYTDKEASQTGITTLDVANMKGLTAQTNMSALDWNNVWVATDSYPEFNPNLLYTDVWDGTKVEPSATDAQGNVIISTAEELAWVILQGGAATQGKSYRVANGIKYFNMNGKQGINVNSTLAEVKAATANSSTYNWTDDSGSFKGAFDGNGVIIYNIYGKPGASYGGLFPFINGINTTIENVSVKASSFYGYHNAGGIIGYGNGQFTVNVNNCAVENCYISDNNNTNTACRRVAAVFVGGSGNMSTNVTNCYAAGNECDAANVEGGIIGNGSAYAPNPIVMSNNVVIGTSPYPVVVGSATLGADVTTRAQYSNNYTDQTITNTGFTQCTTAEMQGNAAIENMPGLAWGVEWFEGKAGEYPSINGKPYADTWDGTKVEPIATDNEGTIIISTAEELAWVILQGGTATQDKNYKVADGMKYFNMNGMQGITVNSTAAQVQSATKNNANNWVNGTNNFMGNFDGNGVIVYNVYGHGAGSYGYSGFFPIVKQTADGDDIIIKNITVQASFFTGYHNAGAVIGLINAPGTSCTATLEKLVAKNCYVSDNGNNNSACQRTVSTIAGAVGHTKLTMSNCFAANNTLSAANIVGGLVGNTSAYSKGVAISNSIVIGTSPIPVDLLATDSHPLQTPTSNATYANVYTDQASSTEGITTLTTAEMQGAGADDAMPGLHWDTDWFTSAPGEYPCFADDGVEYVNDEIEELLAANGYYDDFIANFESVYNRDSFTTSDENCNFYSTGLTLKTNPYMTVTFALHDTYRKDKANVEAVFTVGDQTITVKGNEMINNQGAGRYHLVRLKGISVVNLCNDINVKLIYKGVEVGTGSISVAGFGFTARDAGEGFEYYETAAKALVFYAKALQDRAAVR